MDLPKKIKEIKKNALNKRPKTDLDEYDKYYDDVLIKLHREYSKDEVVNATQKKLSKVEVELGKWKAYAEEMESDIKKITSINNKIIEKNNQTIRELKGKVKELKAKIKESEGYIHDLLNKGY